MGLKRKTNARGNTVMNNVDDVVLRGISSVMGRQSVRTWMGTMTELTTALNRVLSRKQRTFLPGSPSALRMVIDRVANRLRSKGVGVRFGRTSDHTRTRFVKFAR